MKKLAEKLRLLRQEKGFSQQYVADSIGVSVSTISRLENNPAVINLGYFYEIAKFYKIEPRKIFSETENELQENLAKLALHLSIPVDFNSILLFKLAEELQKVELEKESLCK